MFLSALDLILGMSAHLTSGNEVFHELEEYRKVFEAEACVISYAKCHLLLEGKLEDFSVNGIDVSVKGDLAQCELYYGRYLLTLYLSEREIVSYRLRILSN